MRPAPSEALRQQFGGIDIYLFDQLLKGRFDHRGSVLDAGCGGGRNLVYFLRQGYDVHAADRDPSAVAAVRALAAELAPALPADRIRVAEVDALPWPDRSMDAVVSSAVLHFAAGPRHFEAMLQEMWRLLREGGFLFVRLASTIGLAARIELDADRRGRLPDGTERFLVDEGFLLRSTERLGAELLEPIKTTNVQNLRAMTTWCLRKPA